MGFPPLFLRIMAFGIKWWAWVLECLKSSTFSILINGSPTGFFTATRGMRQGVPLSPFLIVTIGEALSQKMYAAAKNSLITGFCPTMMLNKLLTCSSLMTILFCDAEEDHLRNIKAILLYFEAVTGLKSKFFQK